MRETQVRSLGWEDPLEKEMATHSSILAWRIPWSEEPGGLHSMGSQRVGHDWATSFSLSFHFNFFYIYLLFFLCVCVFFFNLPEVFFWIFPGGSVKHPTMWENQVQSLGREDLLEKEMATHSGILAWKIPWMVELGRLQSMASQRVGHDWMFFWFMCAKENNH